MYERQQVTLLRKLLAEPRKYIQVVTGTRQVGKTTLVGQAVANLGLPIVSENADGTLSPDTTWIESVWKRARQHVSESGAVLVIDEIQKVVNWSEIVKRLWDEDTATNTNLYVILLGSSATLIHAGLTESLAGRFERIRVSPWSYSEMVDAFGLSLDEYLRYGGYPGPIDLIHDEPRWLEYIRDSIIEPVISKDLLLANRIDKPFLLRQLLEVGASMSSREISYNKLLGQLNEAGNTTTLANYLQHLSEAGLLTGLGKYARNTVRQRRSSPKLQVFANAIATALGAPWFSSQEPTVNGLLHESAVGAHLLAMSSSLTTEVYWWRDGNLEVDFVVKDPSRILGIEVTNSARHTRKGLEAFKNAYPDASTIIIGPAGIPFEEALKIDPIELA